MVRKRRSDCISKTVTSAKRAVQIGIWIRKKERILSDYQNKLHSLTTRLRNISRIKTRISERLSDARIGNPKFIASFGHDDPEVERLSKMQDNYVERMDKLEERINDIEALAEKIPFHLSTVKSYLSDRIAEIETFGPNSSLYEIKAPQKDAFVRAYDKATPAEKNRCAFEVLGQHFSTCWKTLSEDDGGDNAQ